MGVATPAKGAFASATYHTAQIDQRVIRTPGRTIVIAEIATLTLTSHVETQPKGALFLLAALFALGAGFVATQRPLDGSLNDLALVISGLLTVIFAALALRRPAAEHALVVRTSDGAVTRFVAKDRETADEVRALITDKINDSALNATYTIEFLAGIIEAGLKAPPASEPSPPQRPMVPAASDRTQPPSRASLNGAATPPRSADASASPAWPPGSPFASGARPQSAGTGDVYVDFGAFTAAIVEMHRFYARQPNAEHVEQRLSELELLMRAGSQTASQKTRVRELVRDLSQILQAYPPAVQIFQQIGGLTGAAAPTAAMGNPR